MVHLFQDTDSLNVKSAQKAYRVMTKGEEDAAGVRNL